METLGSSPLAWAALAMTLAHLLVKVIAPIARPSSERSAMIDGFKGEDRILLNEIKTVHNERSSNILAIQAKQLEIIQKISIILDAMLVEIKGRT